MFLKALYFYMQGFFLNKMLKFCILFFYSKSCYIFAPSNNNN